MYEAGPQYHKKYPYFRRLIRAHEFAEQQTVSLIDVFGRNQGLRRAELLWRLGIDTCDKLLAADSNRLAEQIAGHDRMPDDIDQARAKIEVWKAKIRNIKAARHPSTETNESAGNDPNSPT